MLEITLVILAFFGVVFLFSVLLKFVVKVLELLTED